ncbi:hypothetical protein [Athalassotoga sp.]|uniref:hypothetical protein n=1 Tax=Athalassotoga sp. TaxID=2022597 RepID=UPI003D068738
MWRDDFEYYSGYGRGRGRGLGLGLGYGRGCGYGRGYGLGLGYGRGYMTKEELKDFYNYQKKRLELELEELNKAIQDLDKE